GGWARAHQRRATGARTAGALACRASARTEGAVAADRAGGPLAPGGRGASRIERQGRGNAHLPRARTSQHAARAAARAQALTQAVRSGQAVRWLIMLDPQAAEAL